MEGNSIYVRRETIIGVEVYRIKSQTTGKGGLRKCVFKDQNQIFRKNEVWTSYQRTN